MSRVACCFLLVAGLGCSQRSQRAEDFVPSQDQAHTALDAALKAWSNAAPGMSVPGSQPTIEMADELRLQGRTLLEYEILGAAPGDAPRCFAVRLKLGNPAQELRDRYVVLGIDPIWVWRYDDYVMLTHWDHRMIAPKKSPAPNR